VPSFGLQLPSFSFSGVGDDRRFDHVAELARAADESGFTSLWVMDHFWQLPPLGGPDQPILEAYTLLGALATVTERVTLGTMVTGVTYRNPAMLAKIVTTLDVISHGRAVLGIGAAWYVEEHEGLGFDYPPDRERLDRLEEAVQICRGMFREESPTFEGRYYRTREAKNIPGPLRPGGPPILIGGSGEKRTLKLVAQYADASNIFGSPATIRHKLDVLERHCADVGRDPAEITKTSLSTLILTKDAEETAGIEALLRPSAGADFEERFIVGDDRSVIEQATASFDAGIDELIVNMPTADVAAVRHAGELLTGHFGAPAPR
jgi:F420-dependent oxidoreductase-like protein